MCIRDRDYAGGDGNDLVLRWTNQRLLAWGSNWAGQLGLSLIHISEPTRLLSISYAVFCLKKKFF